MQFIHRNARRLAAVALVFTSFAASAEPDQAFYANFESSTLDPNLHVQQFDGNAWSQQPLANWSVNSGNGHLNIVLAPTPAGQSYFPDGPHVNTVKPFSNDFIATVTVDNRNNRGGSGFFFDNAAGYAGIGMNQNGVYLVSSFSPENYFTSVNQGIQTLRIQRSGDTLTFLYKSLQDSSFTKLSELSSPSLGGLAWFDLTNYAGTGDNSQGTVATFSEFSVIPTAVPEPASVVLLVGGLLMLIGVRRERS